MKIEKNAKDLMTPIERKKAIQNGEMADRVMAMPFTSEFKCYLSGISVRDFWFDVKKMAQAERIVFNRYGYDRIVIGPNTSGIVEALGAKRRRELYRLRQALADHLQLLLRFEGWKNCLEIAGNMERKFIG